MTRSTCARKPTNLLIIVSDLRKDALEKEMYGRGGRMAYRWNPVRARLSRVQRVTAMVTSAAAVSAFTVIERDCKVVVRREQQTGGLRTLSVAS